MLNNKEITITECDITFFDDINKVWCVDCWWTETEDTDNTKYQDFDGNNGRCAVVATISKDGENVEWNDNFEEAITEDNENAWVLEEIQDKQREISGEYYNWH